MQSRPFFIGITGAQGTGKSTFAKSLVAASTSRLASSCKLLASIGDTVRALGYPVGLNSTPETIAAVVAAHLTRENQAECDVAILDRCAIDMLAYVRVLELTSDPLLSVYQQIAISRVRELSAVFVMDIRNAKNHPPADHEGPGLRERIDREITRIIEELQIAAIPINYSNPSHVADAVRHVEVRLRETGH